ncbi:hypothetical protein [Dictyobacter kobayashii]|uniref:HAMP domain-containing protein n=1 Tax=Dictyobacter kobayashii TaxID=2014872 RepID=A0A402AM91_9CHLR|nr:hypothetical protein [Dictyobacter kobayashii]GCE20155.1 hypothetical protein KDK_39550 [Dictyobacter kobayashii]
MGKTLADLWYRLFAATEKPGASLSFREKNAIRRSQTSSWILLVVIVLVVIPIPSLINKPFALIPSLIALALDIVALFLNKAKHTRIAGVIAIFTIEAGLIGTILSVPGGATAADIPLFILLLQSSIVASYMIAPGWSFAAAIFNSIVTYLIFQSNIPSEELKHVYIINSSVLTGMIEVNIIVAVFTFIIVLSFNQAIANLDRSEEIVSLERREIARQQEELALKQQLEDGIKQLMDVHMRAANGDFSARVPLNKDNILWRVAYSLNNLLARLATNRNLEQERRKEQQAIHALAARLQEGTLPTQPTGTPVDEIIVALNSQRNWKKSSTQSPPPSSQPLPRGGMIDGALERSSVIPPRTASDAPPPPPSTPWR